MRRTAAILSLTLAFLMLLPLLMPTAHAARAAKPTLMDTESPLLAEFRARAEVAAKRLFTPTDGHLTSALAEYIEKGTIRKGMVLVGGQPEVMIFASKKVDLFELSKYVRMAGIIDLGVGYIIRAAPLSREALKAVSELPGVGKIIENVKIDWQSALKHERELLSLYGEPGPWPANFRAWEHMQVNRVEEEFGVFGNGSVIAIHDTGVDFAAYDLVDALHRDADGYVTAFDPGGLCIALTNYTFRKTEDGFLPISSRPYYVMYWGGTYVRTGKRYYFADFSKFPPLEDIYVGDIESKSGIYHFGIIWEYGPAGEDMGVLQQVYLCVVVDSHEPGVYDTVYIDFDTSLWLTAKLNGIEGFVMNGLGIGPREFDALADWDITDEQPHYWGDPEGNSEILARDINGDGLFDVSAGILANVWDPWGNVTGTCQLIRGIHPSGNWVGILYDWAPHGTACATSAAGRGRIGYDVYENGTYYRMYGMARGAKVMATLAFTLIDVIWGWTWACGWDNYFPGYPYWTIPVAWFRYTGKHKADVISNSWGYVYLDLRDYFVQGFYAPELLIDLLSVPYYTHPDYKGALFVVSAGNEGPGYMTVGSPSVSPAALSISATTDYHVFERVYGRPQPYGDLVSWSSRGPTIYGAPKPDVGTLGAYGFSAYPLMREAHHKIANQWNCWGWFGGTSMSAPVAAGVCALIIDAYKRAHGRKPTPDVVKYIIKSTADDLSWDALSQGCGMINAYRAVAAALGLAEVDGQPIVITYSSRTFREVARKVNPAFQYWWGGWRWETTDIYDHPGLTSTFYDTSLFFYMAPGENDFEAVYAATPVGEPVEAAGAYHYVLWDKRTVDLPKTTGVYNVYPITAYLGEDYMENYFYQADFAILIVSYPLEELNKFWRILARKPYAFLFDWEDINGDNMLNVPESEPGAPGEGRRVSSCFKGANVLTLTVGKPGEVFHRYDPHGTWRGPTILFHDTGPETEALRPWPGLELKLTVLLFKKEPWDWVSVEQTGSPLNWKVSVSVPANAMPGVYVGFVEFYKGSGVARMPMTINVYGVVPGPGEGRLTFGGSAGLPYDVGAVYGIYSTFYWPMANDYRTFAVYVPSDRASYLVTKLTWEQEDTHIGVYIVSGIGQLIDMSNMTYLRRDLGWDGTTTMPKGQMLITPIRGPGVFYIVLQVVRSGHELLPEPFELSVWYITEAIPTSTDVHWYSDGMSLSSGEELVGPHASVTAEWAQVSMSQVPEFEIYKVVMDTYAFYNYTEAVYLPGITGRPMKLGWYEEFYECEIYHYQNFTEGSTVYIEVGWDPSFETTDLCVFVWAPGVNQTYENSLTTWWTLPRYHANPLYGWFRAPTTGTYTIGIDLYWVSYLPERSRIKRYGLPYYLLIKAFFGRRLVAEGTSATLDTQWAIMRNGKIYITSRAYTRANVYYEATITLTVRNYFKPSVSLKSPAPGTLRGIVDVSWSIHDENVDEQHLTDVYVSLDGGESWQGLAYMLTNTSVKWDTRPGSPVGAEYAEGVLLKLVVRDPKYIVEETYGPYTIDNRARGIGWPAGTTLIIAGAAVAAVVAIGVGIFLWRRRAS